MKRSYLYRSAIACALLLSLTACGKKTIPEVKAPEIKEEAEKEDKEETEEDGKEGEERSLPDEPVRLKVISRRIEGEEKYYDENNKPNPYAYILFTEYDMSEEMREYYPEISKCLTDVNRENEEESKDLLASLTDYAREAEKDGYLYSTFCDETETEIKRADDKIFSCLDSGYDWAGGAHPNSGYGCLNIDTMSGKRLSATDVVDIGNADLCDLIVDHLVPIAVDEAEGFEFTDEDYDSMRETIDWEIDEDNLTWTLDDEYLTFYFSPYELMYYALGPIWAEIPLSDNPDLIKEEYLSEGDKEFFDISYKDAKTEVIDMAELEKYTDTDQGGEGDGEDYVTQYYIENPAWDIYYLKDGIFDEMTKSPVTLKKVKEDKSDWLDQNAWSYETGIDLPTDLYSAGYGDGTYYYKADNRSEEGILCLTVSFDETDETLAVFDFADFLNTPTGNAYTNFYIPYAAAYDNTLYVEIAHRTYAEDQPYTGFIVAIDMDNGELLWRSDMQVANGNNFIVGEDTIICGYGFTAEPDYIYILSRKSGGVLEKMKVNSTPDYFIPVDDTLYVLTYNTAYEFNVIE